jgi:pyruvate kinase
MFGSGALLKRRRTKIVSTLGPASSDPIIVEALIRAGANVFRLNFSHGDHPTHQSTYDTVRAVAKKLDEPVAVMADLCGPKIRVGRFDGGRISLVDGEQVVVTTRDVTGTPTLIPSQYELLADDVAPGSRILLNDGLLELRVESVSGTEVTCTVVHGGTLSDRKGINLPDSHVSTPSLTDKDRDDARFALGLGVDFLALSFVRRARDVEELRQLIPAGSATRIIAKIETLDGVDSLDEILEAADGIMVARGDLGVELPPEMVPIAQRDMVTRARIHNKPAIVATQMLESMIQEARPTRAEVSDVANAVFSGTDAVMLSAETASGRFPVAAVEMMDRIARQAEAQQWREGRFAPAVPVTEIDEVPVPLAVSRSTAQLSRDLLVRAIIVISRGGATAEVIAGSRPAAPVIAVTTDEPTWRRMNLLWGVVPILVEPGDLVDPPNVARNLALDLGLAKEGDNILTVSGFGRTEEQRTPTITVLTV